MPTLGLILLDKKDFLASFRRMALPELDPGAHWACLLWYRAIFQLLPRKFDTNSIVQWKQR